MFGGDARRLLMDGLDKGGKSRRVQVFGRIHGNSGYALIDAALKGFGEIHA